VKASCIVFNCRSPDPAANSYFFDYVPWDRGVVQRTTNNARFEKSKNRSHRNNRLISWWTRGAAHGWGAGTITSVSRTHPCRKPHTGKGKRDNNQVFVLLSKGGTITTTSIWTCWWACYQSQTRSAQPNRTSRMLRLLPHSEPAWGTLSSVPGPKSGFCRYRLALACCRSKSITCTRV